MNTINYSILLGPKERIVGWLDGSEGKSTFHVNLDNLSHHGGRREQTVRSCPLTHLRVPTDVKTQMILIFSVCGCLGSGMCRCYQSPEEGVQSGRSSDKIQNKETPEKSSSQTKSLKMACNLILCGQAAGNPTCMHSQPLSYLFSPLKIK